MGASGSGKTTVGTLLAQELEVPFVDSDALHPLANVEKMASGVRLNDEDRWPWLRAVGSALADADQGLVVACSALKRSYRDAIRAEGPDAIFVYLDGSRELFADRLSKRENHFMPPSLLDSQLESLEPLRDDEKGIAMNVLDAPYVIAGEAASAIRAMR